MFAVLARPSAVTWFPEGRRDVRAPVLLCECDITGQSFSLILGLTLAFAGCRMQGKNPCGEYIFDHRNASFSNWFLNEWMIFDELSLYAQLMHRAGA